ncbi:hypothetical protein IGI04_001348 [Brassica rapa subsp. trilocularis]|uniref:Uncharacterized protein n=1 Tax=Brassica rapa subsp. trilocularis TaxID=1813537 RepID=A0ABQ7NUH1_BRACM|nr:hypothetical protein IGI04_001348 [Brassica rapa subsp. trilocularis]
MTKLEDTNSEVFFHSFLRTGLWFSKPGLRQFHSVVRVVLHLGVLGESSSLELTQLSTTMSLKSFLGNCPTGYSYPRPSLVHCWWRCCRVGGECIVGFFACTSICVSQPFSPLFHLAFNNANGYKLKRAHQELDTLEMSRENFGIE